MKKLAERLAIAFLLLLVTALLTTLAQGRTAVRSQAEPAASVWVEPPARRVDYPDGAFSIDIRISGLDHHGRITYDDDGDDVPDREEPSEGLGAYEILLRFDPAVLQVTEAEAGDFLRSSGRSAQCFERVPEPGQYALGCVSTGRVPGPQGSGTLATITLEPLANGDSALELEANLAGPLGDDIPVEAVGGTVEVFGAPTAAPTPGPTPAPDSDTPEGGGPPTVLDGGVLGEPTPPEGGPGANGAGAAPAAEGAGGGGLAGDASNGTQGLPAAGAGYQPPGTTVRPLVLAGALAAAGLGLLLLGARLAARAKHP